MKKTYAILIISLLLMHLGSKAQQQFYNLTADDVRIDSVLPSVAYSFPLPSNYTDSIYEISILYPEFYDMTDADILAYKAVKGSELPPAMPDIEQSVVTSQKKPTLTCCFCPVVYREGKYRFLVSFMVNAVSRPASSQAKAKSLQLNANANASSRYAEHSLLNTGKWAKIRVSETGIHQLTESVIKSAGFTDLSKVKIYGYGGNLVPEVLTDDYLRETDDLKEVPSCTVNGRRLFFAKGSVSWSSASANTRTRNPYSDYGYYFITQATDDTSPASCTEEELLTESNADYGRWHTLHEKDQYAWFDGGRNLFENTAISAGSKATYTISIPSGNTSAKLTVCTTAAASSKVQIAFNDSIIGNQTLTISSTHDKATAATSNWTIKNLKESNTVTITTTSGGPVRLDYISASFSSPEAEPVLSSDVFPVPEYLYRITNQDLHADKSIDMVIIIPASQNFLAQAQRLKSFHEEHDSLVVKIVPADEIYNEFSSGTPDASAYRRYMKMLYDRAGDSISAPRYLLLFGDCAFDNRMLTSDFKSASPDDYLLCFESENSYNEIYCYVSDDFFAILDDGEALNTNDNFLGIPDIGVGRFACSSEVGAKVYVDKTINYGTNSPSGDWQNTIMFLGDDGNDNTHMRDVNTVADNVAARYPGYNIRKVMWDAYTRESSSTGHRYPEVTSIIKQQQADGALIIDYAGHGSTTAISHEMVLVQNDFANFRNTNLPLWVTASCDIMPFDGATDTNGEVCMLNSDGGSVAFYGTTRTVLSSYNRRINDAFMKYVLSYDDSGKPRTLGDANRLTKEYLVTSSLDRTVNKLQYSLLGDPALALALPTLKLVVDSINGQSIDVEEDCDVPLIKANQTVIVKGHIEKAGSKVNDFTGLLSAMVYDTEETITCRLNDNTADGADTPFEYTDRTKKLFQGKDSIRNGDFSFCFAVPKDINYADGTGLMTLYAVNNGKTESANGACEAFHVNDSEEILNDSIGPSIFCYLNTPQFVYGGTVNPSPYFVAEISDKDGINSSGSGIGHDLQLVIDGDINKTYTLNDNFQFDFGSYTTGQTYYILPTLTAGEHTLRFRAWDILNNSSTATLKFNVANGLTPSITDVAVSANPASTTTTFIVSHDRAGSDIDVEIDVMDASGRLLWKNTESVTASGSTYTYTWDLTTSSGARLQTGVYVYSVKVSSDGSDLTSKSRKLVIVR